MRTFVILFLSLFLKFSCFCQQKFWQPVGEGISKYSFELHVDSNFLYTCGNGVSYWDGNSWNLLPDVPNKPSLLTITTADSSIYTGGYYDNVYRFVSGNWEQVGGDFKTRPVIRDLHGFENSVFVRGKFDSIGTKPFNGIAEWNGTEWVEVRGGLKGVGDFENFRNELYAVGNLTWNGSSNQPVSWAKWTGNTWVEADTSAKLKSVSGLRSYGSGMFLFGVYDTILGVKMNGLVDYDGRNYSSIYDSNSIAPRNVTKLDSAIFGYRLYHPQVNRWDYIGVEYKNGRWEEFGGVFNGYIIDLNHYNGQLYFGGSFLHCDTIETGTVSVFKAPTSTYTIVKKEPVSFQVFPNPATEYIVISGAKKGYKAVIRDGLGRVVSSFIIDSNAFSISHLKNGPYFINIHNQKGEIVHFLPLVKN